MDSLTNVFNVTEVTGLKWVCLAASTDPAAPHNSTSADADLVLTAYRECLAQGHLCTWRRKPNASHDAIFNDPAPRAEAEKELWIFWYALNEPKCIEDFKENYGLSTCGDGGDSSGVEAQAALNYETRLLFYKAMHCAFERNLLKAGYLRFGKWFVRPAEMPPPSGFPGIDSSRRRPLPSHVNAVNFHFFIHGETSVCMTVNVQHQPTLVRLSSKAFLRQLCRMPQQVILAPWSLHATLLADQSLLFCGAEKSSTTPNHPTNEQKLARLQWGNWKTEFPEMAAYEGELDRAGLPRMVVVEVGRVRMLYPTCFVAVVIDEMVAIPPDGGGSAEMGRPNGGFVPFCDSSIARASFEDAVVKTADEAPLRMAAHASDVKLENGCSSEERSSSWHIADYVKRESCHCRLCSSTGCEMLPSASALHLGRCSTGGDVLTRAFHSRRTPASNHHKRSRAAESATVIGASTFVAELNALRISTHDEKGLEQWEQPPLWARTTWGASNSRRDPAATARLDLSALGEADVLKALSFNAKQFNLPLLTLPPSFFTSFSPVSSTHHDTASDTMVVDDRALQQRLREFDYAYHPLMKPDTSQCAELYHLAEELEEEMLVGPPRGRREGSEQPTPAQLPHAEDGKVASAARDRYSAHSIGGSESSSILKSLLNNSADENARRNGAMEHRLLMDRCDQEQCSSLTLSSLMRGLPKLAVHRPLLRKRVAHGKQHGCLEGRRRRMRRKIAWPSVDNLDVLVVARMLNEEPDEDTYFEWHEDRREPVATSTAHSSLITQLLRSDVRGATLGEGASADISAPTVDTIGAEAPGTLPMEAVADCVAITDATAATPPALLSTESCDHGETPTTRMMKSEEGEDEMMEGPTESPKPAQTNASSLMPHEELDGHPQPHSIPPPHSSDHLHNMLSPPASNEAQLESLQPGSSGSSIGALLSQQSILNSLPPPLSHADMIYPTPPTPMQQFSPQGALLTSTTHLVVAEAVQSCHHNAGYMVQPPSNSVCSAAAADSSPSIPCKRRLTVEEFSSSKFTTLTEHLFDELLASDSNGRGCEGEVFRGATGVQFPESASFSGDLLAGAGKLSIRLEQLCSHVSYEQQKELKSALKARVKRRRLGGASKTASYRKNLVERMRLPSMDLILASQLERAEMALVASSHRNSLALMPANNRGAGVSPHSLHRTNSIRQQHSLGASAAGGFSPSAQSLVSPTSGSISQPQHSPHRAALARMPPPTPLSAAPLSSSNALQAPLRNAPLEYQLSSISSTSSSSGSSVPPSASGVLPVSGRMFSALAMDSGAMMASQLAACSSFTICALLRDTLLDAHYDTVFDSCPICCCAASIVSSREFGVYLTASDEMRRCMSTPAQAALDELSGFRRLPTPPDGAPAKCSCGFSSVRHRLLCERAQLGLFPDDALEACGRRALAPLHIITQTATHNFDPNAMKERRLIDLLRHMTVSRDLFPSPPRPQHRSELTKRRQYTVSCLEMEEVDSAVVSLTQSLGVVRGLGPNSGDTGHSQNPHNGEASVVHTWGMQLATASCAELGEPRESEYLAEMREIRSITEEVVRRAREGAQSYSTKLEPLSWRALLKRSIKQPLTAAESGNGNGGGEEGNLRAEPLPQLIVATEREPVMVSPQVMSMWEKLSLAPFDQTKDVLYVGIAPDDAVVVEKLRVFLEELSRTYEKCRFGNHARLSLNGRREPARDPILRIPLAACCGRGGSVDQLQALDSTVTGGRELLNSFSTALERELVRFFRENDAVFERRSFHESLLRHSSTQHSYTSLGNTSEANAGAPSGMPPFPPPHLPIQSPNSVLSSTSGPHSTTLAMISPSSSFINNQQQPSPLVSSAPNSAPNPTSSTPDTMQIPPDAGVDAASQHQLQVQQAQMEEFEARLSKTVDDVLSFESANYLPHTIVLYVVNPLGYGRVCGEKMECRSKTALLQTFSAVLHQLNVKRRPQLQLEIVDLRMVLDYVAFTAGDAQRGGDDWSGVTAPTASAQDDLRRLALAVYSQPRLLLADYLKGTIANSMTRFGPASSVAADVIHPALHGESRVYKFPSSAYIIAPPRSISTLSGGKLQLINNEERVLFVSYCLVQGRWLCGALTDGSGHLLDTVLLNISTPCEEGRSWRYRQKSQAYDALRRLWLYVQGFLSSGCGESRNWRLVIGRVGKIGHIEFRVWNELLSKKSLHSYNNRLKSSSENKCRPCTSTPGHTQIAAVLSACLISIEPEPYLRLLLSAQQTETGLTSSSSTSAIAASTPATTPSMTSGGGSSSTKGASSGRSSKPPVSVTPAASTPGDTSLTLIMAFPTIIEQDQSGQLCGQADESDMDNFFGNADNSRPLEEMEDIFSNILDTEAFNVDLGTKIEGEEDEGSIANQPMATGFYISSAPAPDLPDWFWSTCPSQKGRTPVHLKSSLHIHSANVQQSDEITLGGRSGPEAHHPLDSVETDEVLRYVLQSYNALSWLNVDFATGNRLSCLPVHIQVLMRLYRSTDCFSRQ